MYKVTDYIRNGVLFVRNTIFPGNKKLARLMIYATNRCQSRCRHCSIWQKPQDTLSKDEIVSLMFCLSPFNSFKDMEYTIDIAKRYGIDIGIYGTMAYFDTKAEMLQAQGEEHISQIPTNIHDTQENYDFVALYDQWRNEQSIAGIPLEKLGFFTATEQVLAERNNFNPLLTNNQLYTQGFLAEIKAFADMVEHSGENLSPLSSMLSTYKLLTSLKSQSI
ncbi:MAG: hypothetical protein K2M29_09400 [Paramuribaculum sp.]|nr:hypothetical protein [Paramuribaculum sp.]